MKTILILIGLYTSALFGQPYTISTVAGGGAPPDSAPATSVRIPVSFGIARNSAGEIYFTGGNTVYKVDVKGILTRIAGTGQYGLSDDGGPAINAPLAWPAGLAVDGSGNLFIVENAAHRVRKVSPDGKISTVVGTGVAGYSGDGGPATTAQVNWPAAIAVNGSGVLYIGDTANGRIRKVSTNGIISTLTSDLHDAQGLAVDAAGNLYISDHYSIPSSDYCDDGGNIDVGRILKITTDGTTQTLADSGQGANPTASIPRGIVVDASGNVYVADYLGQIVSMISSKGGSTTVLGGYKDSRLMRPIGLAVDGTGNLYIGDTGHNRIAKFTPQGDLSNVVGDGFAGNYWNDGGKATDSTLSNPFGLAVDSSGNLYIGDSGNNRVRRVSTDGTITTVAGNGIPGYSGDGGPATAAQLNRPAGLAIDASHNLYIADVGNNRVRKVSADGTITTVAGRGDYNPPLGDGGPAISAALAQPLGVAVDATGNLYIADTYFFLIRKVSPEGIITTVAGSDFYARGPISLGLPTGLAPDASGDLFIVNSNVLNKLAPNGTFSTIVGNPSVSRPSGDGGPATQATLQLPVAVALDKAGNIYIAGGSLSGFPLAAGYVREITTDGNIATIAGNGTVGYVGDGGPANRASFSAAAAGIAVDGSGTVYVADIFNNVIRALRPSGN